jgi:osmotically-inducible protein OsmY
MAIVSSCALADWVPKSLAMNQLMKSVSAGFLGLMLVTMLGCAATATRESTGQYVDDAAITAKVKAAILDQPNLKSFDVHVATFNGTVYLWGIVASQSTVDEAARVARSVAGVKSVKNDMRTM